MRIHPIDTPKRKVLTDKETYENQRKTNIYMYIYIYIYINNTNNYTK